jgi:precorrin-2 dehydrogenase/sirohydrochlorin ferrochelatase
MAHYPIHLNLAGRRCLVVGGGRVAERKIDALLASGAIVDVVALEAARSIREKALEGDLVLTTDVYRAQHLTGAFLTIAATDDPEVNAAVVRDAREQGILVCRVDDPDGGDFITPAVVRRGDLMLTVSTNGKSPTLAAVVADMIDDKFGDEWAGWTELFGRLRDDVKRVEGGEAGRRAMVQRLMGDTELAKMVQAGDIDGAEEHARRCL